MKAGFIGLGAMGRHMAANLQHAGLLAGVWNRTCSVANEWAAPLGVHVASSAAALAREADAIVLCVSADDDVLQLVREIAPVLREGALVIDCSTVSAAAARDAAQILAARGIDFLDCPVTGGVEGARLRTLAILCGGPQAAFERAQPLLAAMGRAITRFGDHGAGQAAKATNQILCAGNIRAAAEAMAFARAQGLPLEALIDTLGKGAGASWYFVNRAPNMVRGTYPAGFRVSLHLKDLGICRQMAAEHGVALPVVESMIAEYAELIDRGYGDEDVSADFRLKAGLFDEAARRDR